LAVTVFGGYLLPSPCALLMAWWELAPYQCNRAASIASLLLLTLAISVVDRCASPRIAGRRFMSIFSAQVGRWSSLAFYLLPCFAEDKSRRYLLMGAAGLCYFYGIGIGIGELS